MIALRQYIVHHDQDRCLRLVGFFFRPLHGAHGKFRALCFPVNLIQYKIFNFFLVIYGNACFFYLQHRDYRYRRCNMHFLHKIFRIHGKCNERSPLQTQKITYQFSSILKGNYGFGSCNRLLASGQTRIYDLRNAGTAAFHLPRHRRLFSLHLVDQTILLQLAHCQADRTAAYIPVCCQRIFTRNRIAFL